MISAAIKAPVTKVVTPLCRWLLKIGVSANLLSAIGGLGASVSAILFFTHGVYFWGMVVTLFFILFDSTKVAISSLKILSMTGLSSIIDPGNMQQILSLACFLEESTVKYEEEVFNFLGLF